LAITLVKEGSMRVVRSTLITAIGVALAGSASADMIGPAAGYNVFIFGSGSFMSQNTDTMGNLAAGGNVSLMNYAVAQGIAGNTSATPNPARLVVGGKLTAQNGGVGSNQNGAIYYGTTAPSLTNFTARGGQFANQSLVDFGSSTALYHNLSTQLGGLTTTGNTTFDTNSDLLSFTGSNGGLNVFTVSLDTLNASKGIDISALAGSTVLINVTGAGTATFSNGSVVESGTTGAAVLYNFISATSVNLPGSKDPKGSILAPNAAVTGGFGAMSGQLIASSYSGNTQFNDLEFTGVLPVPLPAALWLFGCGLLGLAARRRPPRKP
jgi:choice-of-anchor A domain-containing protein